MINKRLIIGLMLMVLIGGFVRGYQLGDSPAGIYIDEASQGYNAYSILLTGKDEFALPYPILFRSLADFKTPVYTYLIVPLIPLFDLNAFTIRFPSFVFSLLTVLVMCLLIIKITPERKLAVKLGLISGLLLVLSPWHILFGRTDFEANIALFFFLFGVYLFYLGLQKPWVMIISSLIFAVSFSAYHSERILTPMTVIALWIRHREVLLKPSIRKFKIFGLIAAILISLPTLSILNSPGFLARASGLNIFSTHKQLPFGTITDYQGLLNPVVNGSFFLSTKEFFSLYFAYYSPRNMFDLGDYDLRVSYPDLAAFFVWQAPFYLIGLYFLIRKRKDLGELSFITVLLMLIAPIPAAFTRDAYSTIRSLPLVVPQIVIISLGIIYFFEVIDKKARPFVAGVLSIFILFSVMQLYSSGIILNEYYRARDWDYGVEEVAVFLKDKYQTTPVVVDNSRKEIYIHLALFLKHDPLDFQTKNFEVTKKDYYTDLDRIMEKRIGQIITRPIIWESDLKIDQYLVGDALSISVDQIKEHRLKLEKDILFPDQSVAFRIVRTNPEYELSKER